jgi:hypothetical protein
VVTSKDSPGFIANAILMPMINEAILTLEKVCHISSRRHAINSSRICRARRLQSTSIQLSVWVWDIQWVLCGWQT